MHSFSFYIQKNSSSFLPPFFLNIGQDLTRHLLLQAGGFHAIFCHKHGASTLPCRRHPLKLKRLSTLSKEAVLDNPDNSQKGRSQPPVCVVVIQDPSHMLRFRLVEGQFLCPSLPCTSSVLPLSHVSSRGSSLLAIPIFCNKFVVNTCTCWQLVPFTPPVCKLLNFPWSFSLSRRNRIQLCVPFRHY